MAVIKFSCFQCGAGLEYQSQPGRRDECPKCGADVHACRNCRHYDPNVYNACKESQADLVKERERANFCDFFSAKSESSAVAQDPAKRLKDAAEALFKKR